MSLTFVPVSLASPCLRRLTFAVLTSLLLVPAACRDTRPEAFGPAAEAVSTGGRSGTGGRTGRGGAGGAPVAADAKPDVVGAVADASGDRPADGPADGAPDVVSPSDGPAPEVMVVVDTAPPAVDVRPAPPDAGRTGPAACHPDPRVIAICHQLEAACNNCPGGGMGKKPTLDCYAVVQRGDDAACAKYAVDKKCTIDPGGNVCGSLNCGVGSGPAVPAGCNRAACRLAQGNGDSACCQPLLAACACR